MNLNVGLILIRFLNIAATTMALGVPIRAQSAQNCAVQIITNAPNFPKVEVLKVITAVIRGSLFDAKTN
jgi:hypothetical protein